MSGFSAPPRRLFLARPATLTIPLRHLGSRPGDGGRSGPLTRTGWMAGAARLGREVRYPAWLVPALGEIAAEPFHSARLYQDPSTFPISIEHFFVNLFVCPTSDARVRIAIATRARVVSFRTPSGRPQRMRGCEVKEEVFRPIASLNAASISSPRKRRPSTPPPHRHLHPPPRAAPRAPLRHPPRRRPADITVIEPGFERTVDRDASRSRSRNTPFHRWEMKGRAVKTFVGGREVWVNIVRIGARLGYLGCVYTSTAGHCPLPASSSFFCRNADFFC